MIESNGLAFHGVCSIRLKNKFAKERLWNNVFFEYTASHGLQFSIVYAQEKGLTYNMFFEWFGDGVSFDSLLPADTDRRWAQFEKYKDLELKKVELRIVPADDDYFTAYMIILDKKNDPIFFLSTVICSKDKVKPSACAFVAAQYFYFLSKFTHNLHEDFALLPKLHSDKDSKLVLFQIAKMRFEDLSSLYYYEDIKDFIVSKEDQDPKTDEGVMANSCFRYKLTTGSPANDKRYMIAMCVNDESIKFYLPELTETQAMFDLMAYPIRSFSTKFDQQRVPAWMKWMGREFPNKKLQLDHVELKSADSTLYVKMKYRQGSVTTASIGTDTTKEVGLPLVKDVHFAVVDKITIEIVNFNTGYTPSNANIRFHLKDEGDFLGFKGKVILKDRNMLKPKFVLEVPSNRFLYLALEEKKPIGSISNVEINPDTGHYKDKPFESLNDISLKNLETTLDMLGNNDVVQ